MSENQSHYWANVDYQTAMPQEWHDALLRLRQMFIEGKIAIEPVVDSNGRLMYMSVVDVATGIDIFTRPCGLPVKKDAS